MKYTVTTDFNARYTYQVEADSAEQAQAIVEAGLQDGSVKAKEFQNMIRLLSLAPLMMRCLTKVV